MDLAALGEGLGADVRRVSERLRHLSQARLAAAVPPYSSAAGAGRAAAQAMADAAAVLESYVADPGSAGLPPGAPRELPVLSDFAVGDQVAVTGGDLLAAIRLMSELRSAGDGNGPAGGPTVARAVADAADVLRTVRRAI